MTPKNITLSEIGTKKTSIVLFYMYKIPRRSKFIDTENRIKVLRGWMEKRMGS